MSNQDSVHTRNQRSGCVLMLVLALGVVIGLVIGILLVLWPGSPFHRIGGHAPAPSSGETAAAKQLWTCGMHPQIIQNDPGLCPICHMDLTPVKSGGATDASSSGGITIDPAVVQNMGVRTVKVTKQPLQRSIRAVGYLEEAQPNIHDVTLRVSGWIRKLHADTEGMVVKLGDPLFDLYSPELQLAIEELIAARKSVDATQSATDEIGRTTSQSLLNAVSRKLELLGVPVEQIAAMSKLDRAPETITFASAGSGTITQKPIVEGAEVKAGDRALRIVDLSTLWLEVRIFEKDLPAVQIDQRVSIGLPVPSDVDLKGRIIFVSPMIDPMTRTGTARVQIKNESGALRPNMYATAEINLPAIDDALVVPREAIIDTGERQVALVMPKWGHFEPRELRIGATGVDGMVQVLDGLADGETVVTSGQFLLDSESRFREAVQKFLTADAPPALDEDDVEPIAKPENVIPLHGEWQEKLDAAVTEYLKIAKILGASQTEETAIELVPLSIAAHAVHAAWNGMPTEPVAEQLAKTVDAMKDKPLDQQREQFKLVSAALIELAGTHPPSSTIAEEFVVIHCPMAPGDWLQTSNDVANPYYATDMKECGAPVWNITPAKSEKDGHQ